MDVRVGLWRKLSTEELMVLNCGVGEDSWESLGLQGDPTSPFWRKSVLNIHWKDWCWSWSSNTLATWWGRANSLEKTLMLGKTEGRRRRGWQRMRWLDGITDSMDMSLSKFREMVKDRKAWHAATYLVTKSQTWLSNWTTATKTSFRAKNLPYRYTCKSSPSCVTRMFTATLFVIGGKKWGEGTTQLSVSTGLGEL